MKTQRIRSTHAHVVTCDDGTRILYSYTTPVAVHIPGQGYFEASEYYSRTTNSHIREFVRSSTDPVIGKLSEAKLLDIVAEKLGGDFHRRVKGGDVWTNRPTAYGYGSF